MYRDIEKTPEVGGNLPEGEDQKHLASEPIHNQDIAPIVLPPAPSVPWDEMNIGEQTAYMGEHLGLKSLMVHRSIAGKCSCTMPHSDQSNQLGKHPVHAGWKESATSDPAEIKERFSKDPDKNNGIFARESDVFVMDFDPRNGGLESLELLDRMTDYTMPKTVTVLTGSFIIDGRLVRGEHWYYLDEKDRDFPADLSKIGCPGIDIKSNGYAIGPGSVHPSGVKYEWKPGHAPWEIPIARMPQNVLDDIAPFGRRRARSESHSPFGDDEWEDKWSLLMASEVHNTPYAEKALNNACSEIKKMKPGDRRNNALNAKAFSLGHLIGGGQLNYEDARRRLLDAARYSYKSEWPYKEENVENALRAWGGAFELGAREPKYPVSVSAETLDYVNRAFGRKDTSEGSEVIEAVQTGLFDAKGSLQQLKLQKVIQSLGPVKVGPGKNIWRYVDGVWRNDGAEEVIRRTEALLGDASRKSHTDNILHFMSASIPEISGLGPLEYLNCRNGMLRLSDLELLPHDPNYLSTVQLATSWDRMALCPTVDAFLDEMAYEDTIELIWEIIGVCIYIGLGPQRGVFIRGSGRNGKGTLLRLIGGLIPDEFVANIEIQRLGTDTFAAAELFGKILNVVGDLSPKALEDTALFKMLTGEDSINAQRKYGQPFSFTSQATLLFAANKLPHSPDETKGFFSRMLIIPMDKKTIEEGQADKTLEPRMHQELPGVLVKAVAGLKRVLDRGGYQVVERCIQELEDYMNPIDTVESFASSEVHFTGIRTHRVNRKEMYENYEFFCITNDMSPLSKDEFQSEFVKKNASTTRHLKSNGTWVFNGVQLTKNNPY